MPPATAWGCGRSAALGKSPVSVDVPAPIVEIMCSFLKFRSVRRLRGVSRLAHERLLPPPVPPELLAPIPCRLYIKREMSLYRLEELARRHSDQAIKMIVARLADEEEQDYVRCATLECLRSLAEGREVWPVAAICASQGPVHGNWRPRMVALNVLARVAPASCGATVLSAACDALQFAETLSNRTNAGSVQAAAVEALKQATQASSEIEPDAATIATVRSLLENPHASVRCAILKALAAAVGPHCFSSRTSIVRDLTEMVCASGNVAGVSPRSSHVELELLLVIRALAQIATRDHREVAEALESCARRQADPNSPVCTAVEAALRRLLERRGRRPLGRFGALVADLCSEPGA